MNVTNLAGPPERQCGRLYRARGVIEYSIKDLQPGVFANRASTQRQWIKHWSVRSSSLACTLDERIRCAVWMGTKLPCTGVWAICLKRLKTAAEILRNAREARLRLLISARPHQEWCVQLAAAEELGQRWVADRDKKARDAGLFR